jgi:hypothetical protein
MRRRADQPEDPRAKTGKELTQFFSDLGDETKLSEYHANPDGYVQAQKEKGVVSDGAAQLILEGNLQDVQASMKLSGGDSTVMVVFPPT